MIYEFPLHFPRNAFSARNAARAGDIWRGFQDAAMFGSAAAGWPPNRYRALGVAFVVRHMTAVHHREIEYGEKVLARTGISEFRRGLLVTREIKIEGEGGLIAEASQEWAHVSITDAGMRPSRAHPELVEAFHVASSFESARFPAYTPEEGPVHHFGFRSWHTKMDPLAHENHPAYIDWCDEALSVVMAGAGLDPLALRPVAEWVKWRAGVEAPSEVTVQTRLIGLAGSDVVCEHEMRTEAGVAASAKTVRRLADGGTEALALALR